MIFSYFSTIEVKAASSTGKIVLSFEMYNPADKKATLLSEKPVAVEFNGEDTGMSLIKEVLGSENVDESGGLLNHSQ